MANALNMAHPGDTAKACVKDPEFFKVEKPIFIRVSPPATDLRAAIYSTLLCDRSRTSYFVCLRTTSTVRRRSDACSAYLLPTMLTKTGRASSDHCSWRASGPTTFGTSCAFYPFA